MKKLITVLSMASLITMVGCVAHSVPKTEISGNMFGKPFNIGCPKDLDADSITIKAETNGTASVEIKGIHTRMNPEVITTTGDAQAKMIKATADGVTAALGSVASQIK